MRRYFLDFAQAVFFTPQPEAVSAGRFAALFRWQFPSMRHPSLFPQGAWQARFAALRDRITEPGRRGHPEEHIVLACHSLWDPTMAPPGHHLIQGLHFLTPAQVRDPVAVAGARERLLAAAERFYPGATQRVALRRFLVRPMLASVWHQTGQSGAGSLAPVQVPAVPNLFCVGDGTDAPGELSTVACNSALAAASAAARWLEAEGECRLG